jgi:hypothetical protein
MTYRSRIFFTTLILGAASPMVSASATPAPNSYPVVQSSALLHGMGNCVRSQICREIFEQLVRRLAERVVDLMADVATKTAEQLYKLLREILQAPDVCDVFYKIDKLEALLKESGIRCAELQREIEAIRALHR